MKHLMTLLALVVAVTAGAQGTTIHEYPWNPDFNNDTYVGSEDLMGLLSTYGTQFGLPPEPCDYDGTPLEELFTSILTGAIVLDSIFIEYQIEDVASYFLAGCPDPISDTIALSNSALLVNITPTSNFFFANGMDSFGHEANFDFVFSPQIGTYTIHLASSTIAYQGFATDGFFGGSYVASNGSVTLPFPSDWYIDEEGIHIESGWDEGDWPYYANYLHILPYWHYAE